MYRWLFSLLFISFYSFAETHFFYLSDPHANYAHYPTLVPFLLQERESILEKQPDADIFLVLGGDIGGTGKWSDRDRGQAEFELIKQLGRYFRVVIILGNHEGLDFNSSREGNRWFYQQFHDLCQYFRNNLNYYKFKILTGNLNLTRSGADIFESNHRYVLRHNKKKILFSGVAPGNYFRQTQYYFDKGKKIFANDQQLSTEQYLRQLTENMEGKIKTFEKWVLLVHEGASELQSIFSRIAIPEEVRAKLLWVGGGHLHRHVFDTKTLSGIPIVESVSDGQLYHLEFDDEGALKSHRFFSLTDQENAIPSRSVPSWFIPPLLAAEREVNYWTQEYARILVPNPLRKTDSDDERKNLVGEWFVQLLSLAAKQSMRKQRLHLPVVAFYNRLSFGWSDKLRGLFDGPITQGALKEALHFRGIFKGFIVTGNQILKLHRSLHQLGLSMNPPFETPFVSVDLAAIHKKEYYLLVLDHWLAQNGYRVEAWQLLNSVEPVFALDNYESFVRVLKTPGCAEQLSLTSFYELPSP